LHDERVNIGVDVRSDHYLVNARIKIKLTSLRRKRAQQTLDLDLLKYKDVNRFSFLKEKS